MLYVLLFSTRILMNPPSSWKRTSSHTIIILGSQVIELGVPPNPCVV